MILVGNSTDLSKSLRARDARDWHAYHQTVVERTTRHSGVGEEDRPPAQGSDATRRGTDNDDEGITPIQRPHPGWPRRITSPHGRPRAGRERLESDSGFGPANHADNVLLAHVESRSRTRAQLLQQAPRVTQPFSRAAAPAAGGPAVSESPHVKGTSRQTL
jgi:hypothetical protein